MPCPSSTNTKRQKETLDHYAAESGNRGPARLPEQPVDARLRGRTPGELVPSPLGMISQIQP